MVIEEDKACSISEEKSNFNKAVRW